ncbi:MAG: two-component system, OmpR family, phosphate regulon sensor histidine kinase PhoR [Parcubacteria bacterium C7867-001]|nr:MAG: two-component system, OmpR family, phosphate regulon sensor histidine kinase PhoR [Parcubacteria bacterium C7867-001]
MSKTSDENSLTQALRGYSKQFGASGIGFVRKYRYDPFFRTELNVVLLQILYTIIILALVGEGFDILYANVSSEIITGIANNLVSPNPDPQSTSSSVLIAANVEDLKTRGLVLISAGIAAITAIFGYLMTRLALAPTKNALEAQKQFIGNIAHELRTPLSIIKTNTEVRLLDADVTKAAREMHNDNLEELDRISDIINNLLSLNVLVRPEKIPFTNVDLGHVVDRMLRHLTHLIDRKNLTVSVQANGYKEVWGNATALEQIVMNVIRNAATYSANGSIIRVTIEPDYRGHIMLSIEDKGIGIAEKDLAHIFEPFYRADQSRARKSGGSGLGLAIVSELVKLHHGHIVIKSAKNDGTTVSISLPCGRSVDTEETRTKLEPERPEIRMDYSGTLPS